MELAPEARPFGVIAAGIIERLRPKVMRAVLATEMPELPIELEIERKMRAAAFDAYDRGAKMSIIRSGILVQGDKRAEIVRFDQICGDVLERALNRVAPFEWERLGFERP